MPKRRKLSIERPRWDTSIPQNYNMITKINHARVHIFRKHYRNRPLLAPVDCKVRVDSWCWTSHRLLCLVAIWFTDMKFNTDPVIIAQKNLQIYANPHQFMWCEVINFGSVTTEHSGRKIVLHHRHWVWQMAVINISSWHCECAYRFYIFIA